jgi:hypothetical protein
LLLLAAPALADDRDDEVFAEEKAPPAESSPPASPAPAEPPEPGAEPAGTAPTAEQGAPPGKPDASGDLGDPRVAGAAGENREELEKERLQIGGLLYARSALAATEEARWSRQSLTQSYLVDLYLDGRPDNHTRVFALGRMLYTPSAQAADAGTEALLGFSSGAKELALSLDQLWLKFDVLGRLYVTLGKQHVQWGATRMWHPVDVVYAQPRNPLTLLDQRGGVPMLKLHWPVESLGWNAYGLVLFDGVDDLVHVGGAGRLEMVLSTVELGLSAMKRKGRDPRLGLDVSAGVWEFDLTGELGLRRRADGEWKWQASAGLSYGFQINDQDVIMVGTEYFHNPEGYADLDEFADETKAFFMQSFASGKQPTGLPFTFFQAGRHYAALYAVALGPGNWDRTNFTLSVLSNLSDRSGMARLDFSTLFWNRLSLEAYVGANFGEDGEFRFYEGRMEKLYGEVMGSLPPGLGLPSKLDLPRPVGNVGVNLRVPI